MYRYIALYHLQQDPIAPPQAFNLRRQHETMHNLTACFSTGHSIRVFFLNREEASDCAGKGKYGQALDPQLPSEWRSVRKFIDESLF